MSVSFDILGSGLGGRASLRVDCWMVGWTGGQLEFVLMEGVEAWGDTEAATHAATAVTRMFINSTTSSSIYN